MTLRNSGDNCLAKVCSDAWYFHNDARLDLICRRQVKEIRDRLERNNQAITRSRMVAALSLGFCVTLLSRGWMLSAKGAKANFEMKLWRPALHKAFPNRTSLARKQVYQPLDYLRTFRNRIAHHEAIFKRDSRRANAGWDRQCADGRCRWLPGRLGARGRTASVTGPSETRTIAGRYCESWATEYDSPLPTPSRGIGQPSFDTGCRPFRYRKFIGRSDSATKSAHSHQLAD